MRTRHTGPVSLPQRKWRRPGPVVSAPHRPPIVAGLIAVGWAVSVVWLSGFALVFANWLVAPEGHQASSVTLRDASVLWLAANRAPVTLGDTTLTLMPLGLIGLQLLMLIRTTRWATRAGEVSTRRESLLMGSTIVLAYTALAALAALLVSNPQLSVGSVTATLHALAMSLVAVLAVLIPGRVDWSPVPDLVRGAIRPALSVVLGLFALGAIALSVSFAVHFSEMRTILQLMTRGVAEQAYLTLLGVAYLPNFAIWATAYVCGASVLLGTDGIVSLTEAHPAALPAFPALAALPTTSVPYGFAGTVIPVLAGFVLYARLPRSAWLAQGEGLWQSLRGVVRWREFVQAAIAVAVVSLVVFASTALSFGALGDRLLATVGASPISSTAHIALWLSVGLFAMLFIPRFVLALLHWRRQVRRAKVD